MGSRNENRRILHNKSSTSERDLVRWSDFDARYIAVGRGGRLTINLEQLKRDLRIETAMQAAPEVQALELPEIGIFAGAGTTGLVPDPTVEASTFLRDDGTWQTIMGGGGAPSTAQYLVGALDATLTNEQLVTNSARVSWTIGGGTAVADIVAASIGTTQLTDAGVTYAKMQAVGAASTLLGRGTAGGTVVREITLGTNLSMSGDVLNASGGGSTPTGTGFRHVTAGVEDAAALPEDNATLEIGASTLRIKDLGVTTAKINTAAVTNPKIAANAVDTLQIAAGAVVDAKLNSDDIQYGRLLHSVDTRLFGRAVGAGFGSLGVLTPALARQILFGGSGDVTLADIADITSGRLLGRDAGSVPNPGEIEELTLGGGLEWTGTPSGIQRSALTGDVTAAAGSNATSLAAGSVNTIEIVDLAVTGAKIAANAVTNAKLATMAQKTIKGRADAAGTGDPQDLSTAQVQTIINASDTPGTGVDIPKVEATTLRVKETFIRTGNTLRAGLLKYDNTGNATWIAPANDDTVFVKLAGAQVLARQYNVSSFPATTDPGLWIYHTGHRMSYRYDSAGSVWVSNSVFEMDFGFSGSRAATNYLRETASASAPLYGTTYGLIFGFPVKIVGMVALVGASSTCTFTVRDETAAADVTGGALALAAVTQATNEAMFSSTIPSGNLITIRVTSGTANTFTRGKVRFRRVET